MHNNISINEFLNLTPERKKRMSGTRDEAIYRGPLDKIADFFRKIKGVETKLEKLEKLYDAIHKNATPFIINTNVDRFANFNRIRNSFSNQEDRNKFQIAFKNTQKKEIQFLFEGSPIYESKPCNSTITENNYIKDHLTETNDRGIFNIKNDSLPLLRNLLDDIHIYRDAINRRIPRDIIDTAIRLKIKDIKFLDHGSETAVYEGVMNNNPVVLKMIDTWGYDGQPMEAQVKIWNNIIKDNPTITKLGNATYDKYNKIGVFPKINGDSQCASYGFIGSKSYFMLDSGVDGNVKIATIGDKKYRIAIDLGRVYNHNDPYAPLKSSAIPRI
jgi:hypothetical protein